MRVGFIGTGSMGSILVEAFITSKALEPCQIMISNRTREKVYMLCDKYAGLRAAENNIQTVQESDIIFFCIKPREFKNVIDEVCPSLRQDQIVVSITSPVLIEDLEKQLPCKIAKIIPSITNSVHSGASLLLFGSRCTETDKDQLGHLFSQISQPIEIEEANTRVSSDIISCGPAFISYLLQKFIDAAVEETGIDKEEATYLTTEMIVGLASLLSKGPFNLEILQQRVCVPGGVTGAGLAALEKMDSVFNQLFKNTHAKHREDLEELGHMFNK